MAQQGWSSLPAELVNRVADCLLATNDLDCYTDLRAVCQHWRSVTADPRSNQHDPRFRPSRWVMLDELKATCPAITVDDSFLFVNTATGRFIRKSLPHLGDYVFITSTTGGLLVLAALESPYAVRVLNPFTGSLISYAAPMPLEEQLAAAVVGSSPTLVLACISSNRWYWADPQSESFSSEWVLWYAWYPNIPASFKSNNNIAACMLPLIALASGRQLHSDANHVCRQLWSEEYCRCYVAEAAAGDLLAALPLERRHGMDLFKIDSAGNVLEHINKSIGSLALFLGDRSLLVDADRFPSIEANCVYFQLTDHLSNQPYIYKYNIETFDEEQELELVSAAMANDYYDSFRPFTIVQLLSKYAVDISFPLEWSKFLYFDFYYDVEF